MYSPQGITFTRGPGAYKIPAFTDIPLEFNVSLLRNAPNKHAVHSSKAVGEVCPCPPATPGALRRYTGAHSPSAWPPMAQPPLFLGSAVYFALRDAILAARVENGHPSTELFRLDSPATAERIRMACGDAFSQTQVRRRR